MVLAELLTRMTNSDRWHTGRIAKWQPALLTDACPGEVAMVVMELAKAHAARGDAEEHRDLLQTALRMLEARKPKQYPRRPEHDPKYQPEEHNTFEKL